MATEKATICPATAADFERVYPLLQELNNSRLSRSDWQQIFRNHWQIKDFTPGFILQTKEQVVGFIATIYSPQTEPNQARICNLSSWIVRDEYRSSSVLLLLKILRDKKTIFSSFSSNDVSYAVYKKLGFQDWEQYARVLYPLPSFTAANFELITAKEQFKSLISAEEYQIYQDHLHFNCQQMIIRHKQGSYSHLIMVQRGKKLKLYYASNSDFVRQHVSSFRWSLMKFYGVNKLYIGEKIIGQIKPFLSRKKTYRHPMQIKPAKVASRQETIITQVYSELLLLGM